MALPGASSRPAAIAAGGFAGLLAALAMTLLLLVLRAALGLPTPSEMVGDRLTAFISIKQFFALLDQFGGYNGLKQAGGGGVVAGQLVVGALGGAIVALAGQRRHVHVAAAFVALLWLVTVGALWPTLDTNYRGLPPDAARLATGLHLLVCYGVYGLLVVLGLHAVMVQTGGSAARRRLLLGAGGIVLGVAANALLTAPVRPVVHVRLRRHRVSRQRRRANHTQRALLLRDQKHCRSGPEPVGLATGDRRPGGASTRVHL